MRKLNGGDLVVKCLISEGVRYIFTIGGERMLPIYDAVYDEPSIDLIVPRSEAASTSMADGYYRVSGKPGVVLSLVGAGVINEIPPTATALKDNIPIMSITPTVQGWKMDPTQENLHGCEQGDLLGAVTKWNVTIRHWKRIPKLLQYGFREAFTGRKGPVHIDINYEVLYKCKWMSNWALNKMVQNPENTRFAGEIRGDEAMIEETVRLLLTAEKPLIISGGEVSERKAWSDLQEFADYLKIPVLTTKRSIGTMSLDHKCWIGGSNCLRNKNMQDILVQSDVVLLMGCAPSELRDFEHLLDDDMKIIQVDIEPSYIGVNKNRELAIIGDAKSILRDMLSCAKESSSITQETSWIKQLNKAKDAWLKKMNEEMSGDSSPVHPGFLTKEIRGLLKEDAVIIYDGKQAAFWGEAFCPPSLPFTGFFPGDMDVGVGLPMALGAQLASPERQVCTFIEGKSFLYSVRELETAKRYNLPILVIILNDTISQNRERDFRDVDYAKIARGFKCFGERIEDRKDIKDVFLRAMESGLPTVLDVLVSS